MTFFNDSKQHHVDAWTGYQPNRKRFRGKWVGKTVFQSKGADDDSALTDKSNKPVTPDSIESVEKAFVGLRDQLRLSQLKDRRLAQIIGFLDK